MAGDSLTDILAKLNVQSSHNEHSQVEETSLQLLNNGCTNPGTALRYCLVALIQQDKYNKALSVLDKYSKIDEKYGKQLRLEKLYVYYKLNNQKRFENLYSSIVSDDLDVLLKKAPAQLESLRSILHVRAQYCYKNGLYPESYRLYNYLASNNDAGIDNIVEIACNERVPLTVDADLQIQYPLINQNVDDSYDVMFNDAIVLATQHKFHESIALLEQAYSLAKEGGYEADIHTIELQMAYTLELIGRNDDSKEFLNGLTGKLTPGTPMYILAKNNMLSLNDISKFKDNLNLILKELNYETQNSLNIQNFTSAQWTNLVNNAMFLKLFNNESITSHRSVLSKTLSNYSDIVESVTLEPYKTQAKKLYHAAMRAVSSGVQGSVVGLVLLATQLLVVENQTDNAIRLCEHFFNRSVEINKTLTDELITISYVLFELYKQSGRTHSKVLLLRKTSALFNANELLVVSKSTTNKLQFWRHIAFQSLTLSRASDAKALFKKLMIVPYFKENLLNENILQIMKENDSDVFDSSLVAPLVASVDVEALIAAGVKPLESGSSKVQTRGAAVNRIAKKKLELKKQKRKAAKLKKFLATHDVAAKTADPERWLPLRDRSTYRPKKKQLAKQTQGGAMSKQSEQALDISKKSNKSGNQNSKKKKGNKSKR